MRGLIAGIIVINAKGVTPSDKSNYNTNDNLVLGEPIGLKFYPSGVNVLDDKLVISNE